MINFICRHTYCNKQLWTNMICNLIILKHWSWKIGRQANTSIAITLVQEPTINFSHVCFSLFDIHFPAAVRITCNGLLMYAKAMRTRNTLMCILRIGKNFYLIFVQNKNNVKKVKCQEVRIMMHEATLPEHLTHTRITLSAV